jgi:transcriptional regulator with XRE-family HTH domain
MLIHDQLRLAREQIGLSQAKLAALTGLSRNQIVRAEAGENITLDTLRRIMVHLPLEEVTLLERVKMKVDYLNPAEKMFFGIGETLPLLIRATLTVMNLAMVAKAEMAMAQVAEGRTMDEKEQGEDTNLDVLLAQIAVSLGAVETMRQALYKDDSGPAKEG